MISIEKDTSEKLKTIIHWLSLAIFTWIFGYAGLYKIFGESAMMEGMAEIGFGTTFTFLIGLAETAGVAGIIAGFYYRPVRIVAILCLIPFAIGALTVHLSYHHPISVYLNSLLVSILPLVILWTDDKFNIKLG